MIDDRARVRAIFAAGVEAADPQAAVERHLADVADEPALIIAVGKAAIAMARAAMAAKAVTVAAARPDLAARAATAPIPSSCSQRAMPPVLSVQ